jgi:FkbM family methyltransferase
MSAATEDAFDAVPSLRRFLSRLSTSFLERRRGGRLICYLNLRTSVWRNGRKILVPLIGGVGFGNLKASEEWMDCVIPPLLKHKPGAFIDVGVNVGQTLLKVKTLDPGTAYIGFEPNPICFSYVRKLITLNEFQRCMVFPVGLSNAPRLLPFFGSSDADVSGSIITNALRWRIQPLLMHVVVLEGDAVFEQIDRPTIGILKVDVEGGELEVLQGLRATIDRNRPFVLCEILPLYVWDSIGQSRAIRQEQLLTGMRQAGYLIYRILEDATVVQLDTIECHADMSLTNYMFAPVEERGFVEATLRVRRSSDGYAQA